MLKTRCPSCSKLYAVDRQDLNGNLQPQFECLACKTRFAMSVPANLDELKKKPRELGSVVIHWQEMPEIVERAPEPADKPRRDRQEKSLSAEEATAPCLKCGFGNPKAAEECLKCGVVFSRLAPQNEHRFRVKPQVAQAWEKVLENYEDMALHREFVQTCNVHSCLPFAAFRYQSILEADPSEDVAQKMRKYVIALVQAPAVAAQNTGWQPSATRLAKLMRPVFLVLGFVFAFVHMMTDVPTFRYVGIVCLMVAFITYLVCLWKSYGIRFDL